MAWTGNQQRRPHYRMVQREMGMILYSCHGKWTEMVIRCHHRPRTPSQWTLAFPLPLSTVLVWHPLQPMSFCLQEHRPFASDQNWQRGRLGCHALWYCMPFRRRTFCTILPNQWGACEPPGLPFYMTTSERHEATFWQRSLRHGIWSRPWRCGPEFLVSSPLLLLISWLSQ